MAKRFTIIFFNFTFFCLQTEEQARKLSLKPGTKVI